LEELSKIKTIMAEFPQKEFVSRWDRIYQVMEREKIDGLLLGRYENIAYFSGYRRPSKYQFVCDALFLPRDCSPVLLVPVDQRAQASAMTWLDDIRFHVGGGASGLFPNLSTAKETGLSVLRELGFENKVIGVETNPQVSDQRSWNAFTAGLNTRDADDLIWKVRMTKSPLEVKYIRKSVALACKAFEKALVSVRRGMSERELARIVYKSMLDGGAEDTPLGGLLNCKAGKDRYSMSDARPTDYKMRKGDVVILDGGMPYKGYWSDITRMSCIGKPSKRQRELFEACMEAEIAGVEAMQPGKKVSEVYSAAERALEKKGANKNRLPQEPFGHCLGLEIHEPPFITPNSDIEIEPGMVFAIEPCLYDDQVLRSFIEGYTPGGEGVFFVEDNVLITKNGSENLSPISRELNVV
jgi:Xaa-Pro aminopeptidase